MLSEPAARHAQPEPELELEPDFAFAGMRINGNQIDYAPWLGTEEVPLSQAAPGARASRHVGHARLAELRAQHGLGILDELCWKQVFLAQNVDFSVMQLLVAAARG